MLACMPAVAQAADVLDWAPEQAQVAIVFRGADGLADLVDRVDARFGKVGAVARAVKSLRAMTLGEARPAAREWGPGLALQRGIAVYLTGKDEGRLVIGADDPATAMKTIAAHLRALEVPAEVTGDGLAVEDAVLKCGGREGFLVCEAGPPAEKPPGTPSWARTPRVPLDGALSVFVRGEPLQEMTGGPMAQDLWIGARSAEDVFEIVADLGMSPLAAQFPAILSAEGGPVKSFAQVDESSGAVAKLSLDPHALFGRLEAMSGGPSPEMRPVWDALRNHWNGDLLLTFDGGLMHPVVILGLTSPGGGEALMGAVAAAASKDEVAVTTAPHPTRKGLRALAIRVGEAQLQFPYAVVGDTLVLSLSPADTARRVDGRVDALTDVDPTFTERGVDGFRFRGLPAGFWRPWYGEIVHLKGQEAGLLDLQVVLSVAAELLDETGFWVRPRGDGLRARLWWRSL
jgi:hypothetical protein